MAKVSHGFIVATGVNIIARFLKIPRADNYLNLSRLASLDDRIDGLYHISIFMRGNTSSTSES